MVRIVDGEILQDDDHKKTPQQPPVQLRAPPQRLRPPPPRRGAPPLFALTQSPNASLSGYALCAFGFEIDAALLLAVGLCCAVMGARASRGGAQQKSFSMPV